MKKWLLLLLLPVLAHAKGAKIEITIENVRSDKGHILIAMFDSEEGWPMKPLKAERIARMSAKNGVMTKSFNDLKPGKYAVAIVHDENDNKDLDKNEKGMPTEGFGYTNNPPVKEGSAKFSEAAFELKAPGSNQKIKLNYL